VSAQLLVDSGNSELAVHSYEQLARLVPEDAAVASKLADLRARAAAKAHRSAAAGHDVDKKGSP